LLRELLPVKNTYVELSLAFSPFSTAIRNLNQSILLETTFPTLERTYKTRAKNLQEMSKKVQGGGI